MPDESVKTKQRKSFSRREFIRHAGVTAGSAVATAVVMGDEVHAAAPGVVRYGMVVDLMKCVGCKACTVACKAENHTPPALSYNKVMEEGSGEYPNVSRKFVFRPCMHCEKPACMPVCPVEAISKRADGIVVVDYDKCQGVQACISACPYEVPLFDEGKNYYEKQTPYDEQPSPELGENRKREKGKPPIGKMRKCSFCLHRLKKNLPTACTATCIGHAIHFGDLNDTEGKCMAHGEKLQELLAKRKHIRLKEEEGTGPSVYYLT